MLLLKRNINKEFLITLFKKRDDVILISSRKLKEKVFKSKK